MLNVIFWFVRYNSKISTIDPNKKPCAIYLTLENDIYETVERAIASEADGESSNEDALLMRKKPDELFQEMFDNGFNNEHVEVFFKYRYTRSVDAFDIVGMIDELEDLGYETRLVTVDYIARMNSVTNESEERLRIANIVDQLSAHVAKERHVPVVSASQLNRTAQVKIEEAMANGESNIALKMGNSMVGEAWGLIQNADFVMIGDKERNFNAQGEVQDYYVIKNSKLRGRDTGALNQFIQPFVKDNGMRLVEDESLEPGKPKPTPRWFDKLADITSVNEKPQRAVVNQKPPKRKNSEEDNYDGNEEFNTPKAKVNGSATKKKGVVFPSASKKNKVKGKIVRPNTIEPPVDN